MENKNLDGQLSFDSQLENSEIDPRQQTMEFEIGKPEKKDNFVFEVEKAKQEKKTAAEIAEPIVEELVIGVSQDPPTVKEEPTPEEQSRESAPYSAGVPRRKQMYIPRFTEASEKYRKVIDPRTKYSAKDRAGASVSETATEDVDLSSVDPTADMDFIPSAEAERAPKNQVFVNVTPPAHEPGVINVFKFADTEKAEPAPVSEPTPEPTEEEERESIEKLIAEARALSSRTETAPTETVEEEEEPKTDEIADEEEASVSELSDEDFVIPDPVGEIHVETFDDAGRKPAEKTVPDCVRPDDSSSDKKGPSEFTHQTQRDGFKDRFLDSLMSVKIRLGAIGIFSAIMLVFELLASMGVITSTVLPDSGFTGTLAAFDLLFATCVFVLALPEAVRAVKYLAEGKMLPELGLIAGFVVTLAYYVVVIAFPETEYSLYGFIFSVSALSAAFASYYRACGDFTAFRQVSRNEAKKVLDVKLTREMRDENIALDGLVDEYDSKTARIYRGAFVTDFFSRTSTPVANNKRTALMLGIPFGAALVAGVACFFIPGGIISAMSAFALVFLLGCPVFTFLSNKISYFDSQKAALAEDSAVLGEESFFDFAEVDVIAFEDTEIFGTEDVNLKRFMMYGDRDNIERAMRQMYSLFSVVGGPLYKIFANALDNRVRHTPATGIDIEADGISGTVSGTKIYAGNDEYMKRHGIPLPSVSAQNDFGVDTTKVMYAAENGEVKAKFYIRYSFSEEFTMLLPALKEEHIVPLIYTNDPNLSNELLKTLSAGADCMRVVKKLEPCAESEETHRRVSAGVVTYGDKINAINTILLTRKYRDFADKVSIFELYSISIAAAAGALLSVLGVALPSLVYGLWHIAWCVGLRLASKRSFSFEKKDSK